MLCRDVISPTALRIEFGKANEMKQYDQNDKLQHILGNLNIEVETRTMFSSLALPTLSSGSSSNSTPTRRGSRQKKISITNGLSNLPPSNLTKSPRAKDSPLLQIAS